jgi:hypothetical protein
LIPVILSEAKNLADDSASVDATAPPDAPSVIPSAARNLVGTTSFRTPKATGSRKQGAAFSDALRHPTKILDFVQDDTAPNCPLSTVHCSLP